MKKIELDTFYEYQYLGNITYSPNQKKCAYICSRANVEENGYVHDLYVLENGENKQLTFNGKVNQYIWDDENTILFPAIREKADEEKQKQQPYTVFYRLSLTGGEAKRTFDIPLNISTIKQVKKGLYLLQVNYDVRYQTFGKSDEEIKEIMRNQQADQDYEVLEELPYYFNGAGFVDGKRTGLFLYDETNDHVEPVLYDTKINVSLVELDEAHQTVLIVCNRKAPISSAYHMIILYDFKSRQLETLLEDELYSVHDAKFFHGKILFAGSDMREYGLNQNSDFYLLNPTTKEITLFTKYGESTHNSVGSDCRLLGGQSAVVKDGVYYFITTRVHDGCIYALDETGTIKPYLNVSGSCDCFAFGENGVNVVGLYDMKLQEIYHYDGKKLHQLTHHNDWLETYDVIKPISHTIVSDGVEIHGWILLPRNFDETKKYPTILDIHGGPKTVYGEVFYHEMQAWANNGYIVFFLNPRGGDGRGNDFMDIRGKYGTIDYDDIMRFCDAMIEIYPQIDVTKMAVTGGSYGGFMTNWIIGHTDRFAVAASQRSIANWVSFENTSDIGKTFAQDQQQATTWGNMEKLWFHSPLAYADQVKTPTLFIHSDCDFRCPISEGYQMYSALKMHGVNSRLCLFHGENHELSRSGKPLHRLKRLNEITNWIQTYTK